jgi:hypothetical protein
VNGQYCGDILTRQPAVLINTLKYYQSAIEIFCQLCFSVLAWCHIVPQLNSIDKAKPVAKQGRKTTSLKKIADLSEKLVLKRQKQMPKRKFRKSGINILGLVIFILIIIGIFTKL